MKWSSLLSFQKETEHDIEQVYVNVPLKISPLKWDSLAKIIVGNYVVSSIPFSKYFVFLFSEEENWPQA